MVDLQIDPRLARHDPTANMGRKETAQHREAFSIACRDLADDEKTDLDTLVEELVSHTAYYARSDERSAPFAVLVMCDYVTETSLLCQNYEKEGISSSQHART
jgi:hypothetical protein